MNTSKQQRTKQPTIELPNPFADMPEDEDNDDDPDAELTDDDMEMFINDDAPPDMDAFYAEGWEAAESNAKSASNPYEFDSAERAAWKAGWTAYREDMGLENSAHLPGGKL